MFSFFAGVQNANAINVAIENSPTATKREMTALYENKETRTTTVPDKNSSHTGTYQTDANHRATFAWERGYCDRDSELEDCRLPRAWYHDRACSQSLQVALQAQYLCLP